MYGTENEYQNVVIILNKIDAFDFINNNAVNMVCLELDFDNSDFAITYIILFDTIISVYYSRTLSSWRELLTSVKKHEFHAQQKRHFTL